MRERDLWSRIRRGEFPGAWERVEARYPEGFPDSYCVLEGRVIFVELKVVENLYELKRGVSAAQALWNMVHRRKGGEAWVLVMIKGTGQLMWFEDAAALRHGIFQPGLGPF